MGLLIPFVLLPYLVLFVLLLAWYGGDSHDVCNEVGFPLNNPLTLITYKVTIRRVHTAIATYSAYESVDTLVVTIAGPRGIVSSIIKMFKVFYRCP